MASELVREIRFQVTGAVESMRKVAKAYRQLAAAMDDAADRLSEETARRFGKCDGNHAAPKCTDEECWQLDPEDADGE